MIDPFLHIRSHAHATLVEQVMAMHGRGSSNPKEYRRILNRMDLPALRRAIEESDFPELEDTANAIPTRHQTPGVNAPAPGVLATDGH